MKAIKLTLAIGFGLLSFAKLAEAGDLSCSSAEHTASETYDQILEAYDSKKTGRATLYNSEFWDIYEKNRSCEGVVALADKLNGKGITKAGISVGHNAQTTHRQCNPPCTVVIEEPRSAGTTIFRREDP
jgi:hypothetical protein